jgi:hypothetical protein
MKKQIIFLLFLASGLLFAQSAKSLEAVCSSLASHPNTIGDFTQIKTIQTNGRKLKSSGKYIISTQGFLWQTEKPLATSLILTKDAMVQIAANGNKAVMSGKDNQIFGQISETLSSVFSGDVAALKKNFECDFTSGSDGSWKVLLTPKDSTIASVMKTLELSGITKPETAMTTLVMSEASGNSITYEFINPKYPEELSADEKKIFILE